MLGTAKSDWNAAVTILEKATGSSGTWKSYGPKYGWRLDFRKKSGPLAGIYPQKCGVLLGINLIQNEWTPAFELPLSSKTKQILDSSTPLKDGRFLLIPICGPASLKDLTALVQLKTGKPSNA